MEQLDMIFFGLSLVLKVFTVYFVVVALFLLKKRVRPRREKPRTRFAVVVAARNEEAVIGGLVKSVLAQDYPPELRDVYVVPNNCTDGTEAAALSAGARIIGVNNRDLKDFSVDFSNAARLRELVPPECVYVAESGVSSPEDVAALKKAGADAVLMGEVLMRAADKGAMLDAMRKAAL